MIRLQKKLAEAGVSSRRGAVEIIEAGRVKVNGVVIKQPGHSVGSDDKVTVDDRVIEKEEHVYYLLNKPTGYVTTVKDDLKRRTVMSLFEEVDKAQRIFPIGRLDYDTAGILLFTNDGDLAYYLTRPEFEVPKTYLARVEGMLTKVAIKALKTGVKIDNYLTRPARVKAVEYDTKNNSTLVEIIISEGKNQQVRKMMETVGFPVKNLTRVGYAFLTLDGVERGGYRPLKIHEVKKLYGEFKKI
ncbi:rRNA pseudouridine synthase [Acholeplasma vituli]|uniref:Pseudouridine synthase n=1 Tax=Paracholeplasma vituli TaxID=69473 RepID=A0ABT2PWT3_9MOLU|nr:pseudouridine synthase [Paracholeplasma vituli]MCU0105411.1 rRNA pseudouridine synthase [Paracholeplasma vituli]